VKPLVESVRRVLRAAPGFLHLRLGEAVVRTDVPNSAWRDGADSVLGLPGMADLADGESVERRVQRLRYLVRDLDASPRQPYDHQVSCLVLEHSGIDDLPGKQPARLAPIVEPSEPAGKPLHLSDVRSKHAHRTSIDRGRPGGIRLSPDMPSACPHAQRHAAEQVAVRDASIGGTRSLVPPLGERSRQRGLHPV
jgi:hypothetical protein